MCVCVNATLVLAFFSLAHANSKPPSDPISPKISEATKSRIQATFLKAPLHFEPNQGQTDEQVKFLARGAGYQMFLTATEAVMVLRKPAEKQSDMSGQSILDRLTRNSKPETRNFSDSVVRMKLVGANPDAEAAGLQQLPGKVNYFIGNDSKKWRTNISTYAKVEYKDVYPGTNLVYYGNQGKLEYDFVVSPGADPKAIQIAFEGADKIDVDAQGDIILQIAGDQIKMHKPLVYQEVAGVRKEIAAAYLFNPKSASVGLRLASYDSRNPLVIDPVLIYSTYLGGSGAEDAQGLAGISVDGGGNVYVAGETCSSNFPTANAFQSNSGGGCDAFVTKLNSTGSSPLFSTYIGGSQTDRAHGLAIDASGNAYVTGMTTSTNFPTTPGAFQVAYAGGGQDAFVTKLNASGGLVYSTYLGGGRSGGRLCCGASDGGNAIAVDAAGNAYVVGGTDSDDFPTTVGAFQPTAGGGGVDGFVTKLNVDGSGLVYSSFFGGGGREGITGVAVDRGCTALCNAYLSIFADSAVVAKVNGHGSSLVYSLNLGGSTARAIATDLLGNAYVTGTLGGAFVAKIDSTGSILYLTSIPGGDGVGVAVDDLGTVYVAGSTPSTAFFTTPDAFQSSFGGGLSDGFIAKLNTTGNVVYSTYLGGSGDDGAASVALDSAGNIYVLGLTSSTNFPTTPRAFQRSSGGGYDAFVAKLSFNVGSKIAFVFSDNDTAEIYVMNPDGNNRTRLTNKFGGDYAPSWSPDGNKIAFQSTREGLWVMNADGSNQTLLISLATRRSSWSPDGTKIAFDADVNHNGRYQIYTINTDGTNLQQLTTIRPYNFDPAWSPDGTKIAFVSGSDNASLEVYVMDVNGSNQTRLTFNTAAEEIPAWSPDGLKIAFMSNRDGNAEVYVMDASGANQINLTNNPAPDNMPSWSPDGRKIVFASTRDGNAEIYVMNADGSGQTRITNNPDADHYPAWSPFLVVPPVANTGSDQSVIEGSLVTLNGSASTGENLTYQWEQLPGGPVVTLSNSTSATATFTAPLLPGGFGSQVLTFKLTVTSGSQASAAVVNVTVINVNHAPEAHVGAGQVVNEGSLVALDGSASFDPDGDPLTYQWVQTGGPTITLTGADTAQASFTAPSLPGGVGGSVALTFQLTVSDGALSAMDEVQVTVEQDNHAPIADAGEPQTVRPGSVVTLNGTSSYDPDNDPFGYQWVQVSGPSVTLQNATSATPSFTAPQVGTTTMLAFRLTTSDGQLLSDPDDVVITVINGPPLCGLAQALPSLLWPANHGMRVVGITGVTDPNNDSVAITITGVTQDEPVNGVGDGDTSPDAVIQGSQALVRAERWGGGNGRVYQINFSANDGQGGGCSGSVKVTVPHSMKPGSAAVDDGQLYDSTQ